MKPGAVLAVAALAAGVATAPAVRAFGDLRAAQSERAAAYADMAAQAPPPIAVAGLPGRDREDAARGLATRVRRSAAEGGLLVESMVVVADVPPGVVALDLALSGTEKAVVATVDTLERASVPLRFGEWRLRPAAGGVRLEGRLVAPWR